MTSQLFGALSLRVAAVTTAVALTSGAAAAATGHLPDRAQQALADAADRVGFSLPAFDQSLEDLPIEQLEAQGRPEDVATGQPDDLPADDPAAERSQTSQAVLSVIQSYHGDDPRQFGKNQASSDDPSAFGRAVSEAARGSHGDQAPEAGKPAEQSQVPDNYHRPQNPPSDAGDTYRDSNAPREHPPTGTGSDQAESHRPDSPPAKAPARR
ncbi:MAG: hypothetical protein M3O70_26915 [Actinomycetota bacterium]|nr:hypothetical protein [Actinomycetota bacterium]